MSKEALEILWSWVYTSYLIKEYYYLLFVGAT